MTIVPAHPSDAAALARLFIGHISAHPEYISHGEIQMGVGIGELKDGTFVTRPAPDAREKWTKYILGHIGNESLSRVWKLLDEAGEIMGFCVAEIQEDGDEPFGIICDVLVREDFRGHGAGDALIRTAIDWLRSREVSGIYLESGLNNHAAHRFFEKRGFIHVSEIYKLG